MLKADSARKAPVAPERPAWWKAPLPWAAAGIVLLILLFAFPSLHLRVLSARVRSAADGGKRLIRE